MDRAHAARRNILTIIAIAIVYGLALLSAGCDTPTRPTAPTAAPTRPVQRVGVVRASQPTRTGAGPASEFTALEFVAQHGRTVGTPDGGIAWLCRTQPREYVSVEGRREVVIDWYVQPEPCPAEPIE